jgi:hypothetical protein
MKPGHAGFFYAEYQVIAYFSQSAAPRTYMFQQHS